MNAHDLTISAEIDARTAKVVIDGLDAFNAIHNGPDPTKPLWVISRDSTGMISGGLQGLVQWDWFAIGMLWVREKDRGRGLGSRLLAKGEEAAREHGCTRSRLATMTFQAPEFYIKRGYVEICRLPDVPPGLSYIWMSKRLCELV